ncbi:MAG TPA: CoA-binding protein [Deltaproteobacteria bacterium]|nr:CoA-binding protein [Deltaproteobacteria bacterium]HPP79544.1 CoA-binding protein [Deltaproteobacteria bacterium]
MDLHRLFHPESVAVVGASPHIGGGKLPYYQVLQMAGYKGRLYPVNPKYDSIAGAKVYASLDDLPEPVDLAIASVPYEKALETVEAAARRGVKFIHFFTSGFSEVGNHDLERAMVEAARRGGTRIVGPNCIGIHCQASAITCDVPRAPLSGVGDVAFLGQSGGMTHNFMRMATARYMELNKVVSYGNQIDLGVDDYLEYLAGDETVKVIACYIEDIKRGRRFAEVLGRAVSKKPVIVLKGGVTEQGAKAAYSHTGAMAARHELWTALMHQRRAIEAETFEHLMDLAMVAVARRRPEGPRLGFLGAGGGTSVLFTDLSSRAGLALPQLHTATQRRIASRISSVNTSTANPVDLGFYGFDFTIMAHTIEAMASDPSIDVIVPYFSLDFITSFQKDQIETGPHAIVQAASSIDKPVVPILSQFTENSIDIEEVRIRMTAIFRKAGLAVYRTPQDAVAAIQGYLTWRRGLSPAGETLHRDAVPLREEREAAKA